VHNAHAFMKGEASQEIRIPIKISARRQLRLLAFRRTYHQWKRVPRTETTF